MKWNGLIRKKESRRVKWNNEEKRGENRRGVKWINEEKREEIRGME